MMDIVKQVESIVGSAEESQVVEMLVMNVQDAIKLYCNTDAVPERLRFIVVEASVSRYNRLGAEGLSSEGVDSVSQSFIQDVLDPYRVYMDAYNDAQGSTVVGRVILA